MKTKKKRVGSFLCFGAPVTDENEAIKKKQRPAKDSAEVDGSVKNNHRRSMPKIVKSISFKSSSSNRDDKLQKDTSFSLSRKVSDLSENPSPSESFGKNSYPAMFSSSLSSSSCSSSSSSSSSSSCISPEPKLQRNRTFMPPTAPRNNGYATGLFLVLLSLFVMVFCGRLVAILWTATWLCLVPRRRTDGKPPEFSGVAAAAAAVEMRRKGHCRDEEKKRVVLEGLLQRNKKGLS